MTALASWAPQAWALADDWRPVWSSFLASPVGQSLGHAVSQRLSEGATIFPAEPLRALALTSLQETRVVILGQDPYHGPGQAEGLAFSVPAHVKPPPSLRNMHAELQREFGQPPPGSSLVGWARQGVLLLNTSLTVEQGAPASHARLGWQVFTDDLIQHCNAHGRAKAFLLWGAHAQAKQAWVQRPDHLVLVANHPSPLSARRPPAPFIGCGHFGQVNGWLRERGEKTIDWFSVC